MNIRPFENTHPQINDSAYIDPNALVIGKVTLGKDCSVWPMTVIRGDVNVISIGDRTNIQDNSVLHVTRPEPQHPEGFGLNIGQEVTVGHRVTLHGCTIKDRCLIGMGSTIMDGAVLHPEIILGACSLVPPGKALESGYLWLGSPVKKIRPITDKEKEFLVTSANGYVDLKNKHMSK